jgi:hypothetical protein
MFVTLSFLLKLGARFAEQTPPYGSLTTQRISGGELLFKLVRNFDIEAAG